MRMTERPDIYNRIESAQREFLERSAPYFSEIARIHSMAKFQFLITKDMKIVDWSPVFSEDTQKTLKCIYDSIDHIKGQLIKDYKLENYL